MAEDDRTPDPHEEHSTLEEVAGLARVAASAWWHTAEWTVETSARNARRLLGLAASPEAAADIAQDVGEAARGYARDLSESDLGERVRSAVPEGGVAGRLMAAATEVARAGDGSSQDTLVAKGDELLRLSRDVHFDAEAHPAHERILDELHPDEGRILRLLLLKGPQPAVDVRTGGPVGLVNSKLIASGFTMIGARAGLRYVDRVPSYLNNLFRLGMVWFSRETLHDHLAYQVLEAQPEVLEAMHSVRFPRVVRRSIHLTPFGADFCRDCLSLETVKLEALPEHTAPEENMSVGAPPPE